jgi:hypothetical protein
MKVASMSRMTVVSYLFLAVLIGAMIFAPKIAVIVCPAILTAQLYLFPDLFRSRRGSLAMARYLVGALWLASGIIIACQ